ncbi:helicase-related protein [Nakamurella sp. GG22]
MTPLPGIDLSGPRRSHGQAHLIAAEEVDRQHATARGILDRLPGRAVQLLADEVGMGKTYVALAVASALRPPARSCKVAVLVPTQELADKWTEEVHEFNATCVTQPGLTLRPVKPGGSYQVSDLEQLADQAPRRQLAVVRYGAHGLASKQLPNSGERLAAAAWALSLHRRVSTHKQDLRHAYTPEGRPGASQLITAITALQKANRPLIPRPRPGGKNGWAPTQIEGVTGSELWLAAIEAVSQHGARDPRTADALRRLARGALLSQINAFDLVIVDEAHNWVNRANGADPARLAYLHQARHALLLTATPLQLEAGDLPALLGQFTDLGSALRTKPPGELADKLPQVSEQLVNASLAATRFRAVWHALPADASAESAGADVFADDTPTQKAIEELDRANRQLERVLRPWLIRHRHSRAHRRILIGDEFTVQNVGENPQAILDRTALHEAAGLEDDHAELAQLALMRLVSIVLTAEGRTGRTTLAASMTGCYSTITVSKEAAQLRTATSEAAPYLNLIKPHVDVEKKLLAGKPVKLANLHPKVRTTLRVVDDLWQRGEKVLIFCWRVNTAKVVAAAIRQQLRTQISDSRWVGLQSRLSTSPLLAATQDRIIHSLCLAGRITIPYQQLVTRTREETINRLVVDQSRRISPNDLRRLHSQHQAILAAEVIRVKAADESATALLRELIRVETHRKPGSFKVTAPSPEPVLQSLLENPALFTGPIKNQGDRKATGSLAHNLDTYTQRFITTPGDALKRRAMLVAALASATQSTRTLSRLPGINPDHHPDAQALSTAISKPMGAGGHARSMLDRLAELVNELTAIESLTNLDDRLNELRVSQERPPVDEINGATGHDERRRLFARFNSPLFPDVLVCTQIGGEGIDLHQYCRVVIHYDLSFNPSKLEQRTGRCDRIGSRSRKERTDLIVGVPLLAGSYDERIFATLLRRDREQEALIGAGIGGDQDISAIEQDRPDEVMDTADLHRKTRPIPPELIEKLRCDFTIWKARRIEQA